MPRQKAEETAIATSENPETVTGAIFDDREFHAVFYGDAGVGKSTLAASIAHPSRPLCVWFFDARGKEIPFYGRKKGWVVKPDELTDRWGTPYKEVVDADGRLVVRVEFYHDRNYKNPESAERFLSRVQRAQRERNRGEFWGFVLDSTTSAGLKMRKYHQYLRGAATRSERASLQAYSGETDEIENILLCQMPQHRGTMIACMHTSKTKVEAEGTMVRAPLLRGRNFEALASQWPEVYRLYVDIDEDTKKRRRRIQTVNDEKWMCTTVLGVPDGAPARWNVIEKFL